MKKRKLKHSTLKLNKGRIAALQAGTIFGGEDKGGRQKATYEDCIDTIDCPASTGSVNILTCPEPYVKTVDGCTY
ncbi:MAG: hypothetical protein AAF611_13890 [Bacteroidota bacterium]